MLVSGRSTWICRPSGWAIGGLLYTGKIRGEGKGAHPGGHVLAVLLDVGGGDVGERPIHVDLPAMGLGHRGAPLRGEDTRGGEGGRRGGTRQRGRGPCS